MSVLQNLFKSKKKSSEFFLDEDTLKEWFQPANPLPEYQHKSFLAKNSVTPHYPDIDEICQRLYAGENVHEYWKNHGYQPQTQCEAKPEYAHFGDATINAIWDVCEPKFFVEVGSFIGASALAFGNKLQKTGGLMLCIDTWCGDINMWTLDVFVNHMDLRDGDPALYAHFMKNIQNYELTNTVFPLRLSSLVGARLIHSFGWTPDVVYLDSAHVLGETFFELNLYWNILKPGGVLLGDDYHGFPAVKRDVDLFLQFKGLDLKNDLIFTGDGDTYMIVK